MSQEQGGQGAAPVPAVVLAGSRTQKPFFEGDTPGYKALMPLLDRPMIEWTVDAVEGAPGVRDLLVVAPDEVGRALAEHPRVTVVPDHGGFLANILAGLEAAEGERVLFVNCDVPLVRPEMIEHFLQHAPTEPDVVVSAVEQSSLSKLPQAPSKPFRRLGDGAFAHGNLFLINHRERDLELLHRSLDKMYGRRKLAVLAAAALGPGFLCWFLWRCLILHQAPLAELVERAGRLLGLGAAVVVSPYPEVALDVDEPDDYAFAQSVLLGETEPH